jgi:phosphatidate cytidylyltransferase
MAQLLSREDRPTRARYAALWCAVLAGSGALAPDDAALRAELRLAVVSASFVALLMLHLRDTRARAIEEIAVSFVPVVFVGLLLSWCRELAVDPDGARRIVWVTLVAKASDMGGWLVGKPWGKHKMIPSVSPGKSWEGLAGGLVASALFAAAMPGPLGLAEARWGIPLLALFGVALGGAAVFAGIAQSAWKRRVGAKDSSRLVPEMGGVLDLVDSLLFAGPVAVLWLRAAERLAGS